MARGNSTMAELSTQHQDASRAVQCSPSVIEQVQFKNRLQEYTQKSSILLPVYHTVNEGSAHAPKFKSTVLVDGKEFVSPNTFSTRKGAEQDVARIALDNIYQNSKDDCPVVSQDIVFCKSTLNEYAMKMNLPNPTYDTSCSMELLPTFVSEVTFNGVKYRGEISKNKKEAEQTAARAAILSALESASRTVMLETVKSKSKLYATFHKDATSTETPSSKRKEKVVEGAKENQETFDAQSVVNQVIRVPHHQFKKPKVESSSEVVALPIVYVPSALGVSLTCSTSGKKGKRKGKDNKETAERDQGNTHSAIAATPVNQVPQPTA